MPVPFTQPPPTQLRRGGRRTLLVDEHLAAMADDDRAGALAWLLSAASDRHVAEKFTDEGYVSSQQAVHNWRKAHQ